MTCLGFATAAAIPVYVPVLLHSVIQAHGTTFGTRDLNLMIHPEIEAIVEAGTDESTVRDKTVQMFFEFGRLLE